MIFGDRLVVVVVPFVIQFKWTYRLVLSGTNRSDQTTVMCYGQFQKIDLWQQQETKAVAILMLRMADETIMNSRRSSFPIAIKTSSKGRDDALARDAISA